MVSRGRAEKGDRGRLPQCSRDRYGVRWHLVVAGYVGQLGCGRVGVCQSTVGHRLLQCHVPTSGPNFLEDTARRWLQQVPGALDSSERAAVAKMQSLGEYAYLLRTAGRYPYPDAVRGQVTQRTQQSIVVQGRTVWGDTVNQIEIGTRALRVQGLGALTAEGIERMVVDLVLLHLLSPVRDVGVSPLGADGEIASPFGVDA